jgi:uncharacterized phage protein (TIGR02218 family)
VKTLQGSLGTLLASGTTTLCNCWLVERIDGETFGFTDHDRQLSFGGHDYEPESGFTPSAAEQSLGLAVDTMEVEGALRSDAITEADIALGRWDNASVTVFAVDWSDTANRVILQKGGLGELVRGDGLFTAEIRSLAHVLNQEGGRTYSRICDAVVGDTRCGVDLGDPDFAGAGSVTSSIDNRVLIVSGLSSFEGSWFARGVLTWTTGASAGAKAMVRSHLKDGSGAVQLVLWEVGGASIEPGDDFEITAGCDKTFPTCHAKFDNAISFRGFPHIPGNDFVMGVAKTDQSNDGGSLFS